MGEYSRRLTVKGTERYHREFVTVTFDKEDAFIAATHIDRAHMEYIAKSKQYRHWLPLFTVMLGTGCRVGEIVGLRWED